MQNENVTKILQGVIQQLEEKAVGLGTVTHAGLQDAITKILKEAGVIRVMEFIENPAPKVPHEMWQQVPIPIPFIIGVVNFTTFRRLFSSLPVVCSKRGGIGVSEMSPMDILL